MKNLYKILLLTGIVLNACSYNPDNIKKINAFPKVFPDYKFVTIPVNIAPLNFLVDSCDGIIATFSGKKSNFSCEGNGGEVIISPEKWSELIRNNVEDSISVVLKIEKENEWFEYLPFSIYIKKEPVDDYLAYRLIAPGYQKWSEMGIYQRELSSYDQNCIVNSKLLPGTCMNCHSFANRDAEKMMIHFRQENSGTLLVEKNNLSKLLTKTDYTISNCAYPYWHPSGQFIGFSVDKTAQMFHSRSEKRIDVFDSESDIVIYDIENNELFSSPLISSKENFEVAPSFSSDGNQMFFCSSLAQNMPYDYDKVKYSLLSVGFDSETRTIGESVDTLFSALKTGKSVSFPRISPDGKFLLFSLADYGYFHIWHKESDLYLMNLETREYFPLENTNSDDTESYHCWSSNGRWIVFSSRRIDGLYTHPHFAYIDQYGKSSKAFVMPQNDPKFYREFMKSFNVPEFVASKIKTNSYDIEEAIKSKGKQVLFRK